MDTNNGDKQYPTPPANLNIAPPQGQDNYDISAALVRFKDLLKRNYRSGNAFTIMELMASRSRLKLQSQITSLTKLNSVEIFTNLLTVQKESDNCLPIFLARGFAYSKQLARQDSYSRARLLLLTSKISDIQAQVDYGEAYWVYTFNSQSAIDNAGYLDSVLSNINLRRKRSWDGTPQPSLSLTTFMEIRTKLDVLKQLMISEELDFSNLVPKLDELALRARLSIRTVYNYVKIPITGFESASPFYCKIFLGDISIARGPAMTDREACTKESYYYLALTLFSDEHDQVLKNPELWSNHYALEATFIDSTARQSEV